MICPPARPLPVNDQFSSPDEYVDSLLGFITGSTLFQHLCGGIHILDFFTRDPDLYSSVLPDDWPGWMDQVDILHFLDLLMRDDLTPFLIQDGEGGGERPTRWRDYPAPPDSLVRFITDVRRHMLDKRFSTIEQSPGVQGQKSGESVGSSSPLLPPHIAAGMTSKKVHEVAHFSRFADQLATQLEQADPDGTPIRFVDFGSGQNYLGRVLASSMYGRDIIAVETRSQNIEGAKALDIHAGLRPRPRVIVNKKAIRLAKYGPREGKRHQLREHRPPDQPAPAAVPLPSSQPAVGDSAHGAIEYINHFVVGGDLGPIIKQSDGASKESNPRLVTVSLHSCGNLVHHGLRTVAANPAVKAVALVGCCYNLMTERLTAEPSYKHPGLALLRPASEPADRSSCSQVGDPDGFPMSKRLGQYQSALALPTGINLNITSRMMAVQAPHNWGPTDSDSFFTRHFYRALLQRLFVDLGLATKPDAETSPLKLITSTKTSTGPRMAAKTSTADASSESCDSPVGAGPGEPVASPLIIGPLPKPAYRSFVAYVRAAQDKIHRLGQSPENSTPGANSELAGGSTLDGPAAVGMSSTFASGLDRKHHLEAAAGLATLSDDQIAQYEHGLLPRRQQLSCLWTLMAFCATVVEAVIVVDRWAWLKELVLTDGSRLSHVWVQTVFDGAISPRNFCIVGAR